MGRGRTGLGEKNKGKERVQGELKVQINREIERKGKGKEKGREERLIPTRFSSTIKYSAWLAHRGRSVICTITLSIDNAWSGVCCETVKLNAFSWYN